MGAQLEVDFESMQTMIDHLTLALSELEAAGVTLDNESRALLDAWEGDAADAYDTRHREWNADHVYSAQELSRAIAALTRALRRYEDAEARILELVT